MNVGEIGINPSVSGKGIDLSNQKLFLFSCIQR